MTSFCTKSSGPSFKRPAIGAILLIGGLTYFNTLGNGFVNFDDNDTRLLQNPFLGTPWQWDFLLKAFSQATAGYYDPVYVLSYAVDYHLWGMNPAGFHMGNLILHLANSVFIFLILWRLTGKQTLAFVSAVLFVVHPIHVESVSWATSRKDTLSHFFALASFWVYLRGIYLHAPRFTCMATLSGFLLMLGMMVKPTVIVLPAIFLLSDLIFGARPIPWKRIFIFQSACLSFLLLFVVLTFPLTLGAGIKPEISFSSATHLSLFFNLYSFFIKLIVFPLNLSAFYVIRAGNSISLVWLLFILPCFLAWVGWIIRQMARTVDAPSHYGPAPVLWGSAVYLISLLPFTNILPRTIYLADRYEYMASLGFCLILAYFLTRIPSPNIKASAVVFFVFIYGVLTIHRIPVWKDSPTLWADVDLKRNISPSQHHWVMGNAYAFQAQWDKAVIEYEAAGADQSNDPDTRLRLANIYLTVGNWGRAENITRKIIADFPDYLPAMTRLVTLHIRAGEYEKADRILNEFKGKFEPEEISYFNELVQHVKTGNHDKASFIYRKLTQLIASRTTHVQQQNPIRSGPGA
ncbi:hypothetical protein UR09_00420 [Candidatus Nitromaritima sp. SCGC AAA799-A02]|nr:hypothetical protein UR09_00420 [Candidatus Nitromaritima sp. SCGC AAA799-A02]